MNNWRDEKERLLLTDQHFFKRVESNYKKKA